MRLGPALGGRPGVEEDLAVDTQLVDRDVTVPEHDQLRTREPTMEPIGAPFRRSAVVDQGDRHVCKLEELVIRQHSCQVAVIVPEHGNDLRDGTQLLEGLERRDVAGVEHDVRFRHGPEHLIAEGVEPPRKMAVREDYHLHRRPMPSQDIRQCPAP